MKKTPNKYYQNSVSKSGAGFTVAEIIIAISVLSFGILLVYSSFYSIFAATHNLAPRFTATYLAREGLEIVRSLRDNNFINNAPWSAGLTGSPCNVGCQLDYKTTNTSQLAPYDDNVFLGLNSHGFYGYDAGNTPTIFKRKITITPVSSDIVNVEILITWTYNGQLLNFTTNGYLYNWH